MTPLAMGDLTVGDILLVVLLFVGIVLFTLALFFLIRKIVCRMGLGEGGSFLTALPIAIGITADLLFLWNALT